MLPDAMPMARSGSKALGEGETGVLTCMGGPGGGGAEDVEAAFMKPKADPGSVAVRVAALAEGCFEDKI